jgi:type IV pilus assembly protein PilN
MRVPVNLATRPFVNVRPFVVTTAVLGGAALVLTLLVLVVGVTTWRERATTLARLHRLDSERVRLITEQRRLETELRTPATQQLLERTHFLNQLIRQKGLSWTELFFDLQQCLPLQVRILSLSPSLREDGHLLVELRVGGASAAAVIDFLRALEEGEKFRDVVLRGQRRGTGSASDEMTAEVTAVYVQE